MIPAGIREEIARRLDSIEAEHQVKIVFACESGSRAWGFASTDSDYDVRFIYVRSKDWYLSIDVESRRDVIETPIEGVWDVNGWDLRKALRLLRKSNPPLLEWLQSPIVYRQDSEVVARFRQAMSVFYSPRSAMYHYLSMARGNVREYLKGDVVWRKKYFYVLRPLLACRWIEARDEVVVPMEFQVLLEATVKDKSLLRAVEELLAEKRAGGEQDRGPRIPEISDFCLAELDRLDQNEVGKRETEDPERLNQLFREVLETLG